MDSLELLQQLGFSSYEAEAYTTLLTRGPLTGYEVGKYSRVPLSRSYEILQRLHQKGIVLLQPGDPPRYLAQDPQLMLAHFRSDMEQALDNLTHLLDHLPHLDATHEFWVVRQRDTILTYAQDLIESAQHRIMLTLPMDDQEDISKALLKAQRRGCSVIRVQLPITRPLYNLLVLLVDDRQTLVGSLDPANTCQAIVSAHEVLLLVVRSYFGHTETERNTLFSSVQPSSTVDWLAWEERKQRRVRTEIRSA